MDKNPKRGYWYLTTYYDCPVCGRSEKLKERVYDRQKPDDPSERYEYEYLNCYCYIFDIGG